MSQPVEITIPLGATIHLHGDESEYVITAKPPRLTADQIVTGSSITGTTPEGATTSVSPDYDDGIRSVHPGRCRCGKRVSQDSQSCTWHTSVQAHVISEVARELIRSGDPTTVIRNAIAVLEKGRG